MTPVAAAGSVEAFLRQCGLDAAVVRQLARRAKACASPIDVVAVAEGYLSHGVMMSRLAQVLGCTYLDEPGDLRIAAEPGAFQAEAVRILKPGGLAVLACPSGEALAYLLGSSQQQRPWLALTSRARFRERLRQDLGPDLARQAALPPSARAEGADAAATRPRPWGLLAAALLLAGLATMLLFGASVAGLAIMAAALAPLFLAVVVLRLSATAARVAYGPPGRVLNDAQLPSYAAIVPLYREAAVVPQLIQALSALDYPRSKFSALLVLEEDDTDTRAALERLSLPAWVEVIVAPDGQPRTKPRALNIALGQTAARLVTIFDAEDIPDPDQLRIAATCLLYGPPDVGAYQAALDVDNGEDTPIAGLFALEYGALFRLINPYLHSMGLPFLLGGTSNHFRRADLIAIGGWDAANLTEDAEIGIRLLEHGCVIQTLPSRTQEEAPIAWNNWLRQRIRWMKGFIQTLYRVATRPSALIAARGIGDLLTIIVLLGGTVLSALCLPAAWAGLAVVVIQEPWPAGNQWGQAALYSVGLVLFLSGLLAMVLPGLAIGPRTSARRYRLLALLTPFYALAVSIAAWVAVIELMRRPLYWDKTEHGLSPARRMRSQIGADGRSGPVDVQ